MSEGLQMGLRERLRACLFTERRGSFDDEEMDASTSTSSDSSTEPGSTSHGAGGSRKRGQEELSPAGCTDSLVLRYALNMQTQNPRPRGEHFREVQQHCASRIPSLLVEKEWGVEGLKSYDKAFAAAWVSERQVLVGTKCNKLLEVDTRTGSTHELPLSLREACSNVAPSSQRALQDSTKCGIHSVAISPTGEYVAVGGANPLHCSVLKTNRRLNSCPQTCLEAPKYSHVQTMTGHTDWIFGSAWVSENHLVTCSKDTSMALWAVDPNGSDSEEIPTITKPLVLQNLHKRKVRDVKFCFENQLLASLSSDATVRLWDAQLQPIRKMELAYSDELVCLAQQSDLVAVGSQHHVMLMDSRTKRASTVNIPTLERNQSIRSLSFHNSMLTVGSGFGKVSFYDLKAGKFLEWGNKGSTRQMLEMGKGWVCPNTIFRDHFFLTPMQPACYAHCWDTSGTRLFTCGGPLAFGLVGCYMGLWQ